MVAKRDEARVRDEALHGAWPRDVDLEELAQTIGRHYETAQKLNLLREDTPHLTLQASDDQDKTYFVDIFTWRDAAVPDNAPREIQAIWKEMNGLVEMRGGRPALDIVPVKPVAITSGK